MITDNALLEEFYAPNRWFQTCKDFLLITDMENAGYLSYLVGVARTVHAAEKADGWFYHTHTQIESEVYVPRWKWVRIVKTLKQLGYLETKLVGIPAKSYYRVNLRKLHGEIVAARIKRESEQQVVANSQQLGVADSQQQDVADSQQHSRYSSRTKLEDKKHSSERGSAASLGCASSSTSTNGTSRTSSPIEVFPHSHSNKGYAPEDRERAAKLDKALLTKGLLFSRTDIDKWSKEFSKLREFQPAAVIDEVLDWYVVHVGERFIPRKLNAKTFRENFGAIKLAFEDSKISSTSENTKHSAPVQLPPEVKKILTELTQLTWPKGSASQLPSILLQSYNFYEAFLSKLDDFILSDKRNDPNKGKKTIVVTSETHNSRFIEHLRSTLHEPYEFILLWFTDYNERLLSWSKWSGKLEPLSLTNKQFQQMGKQEADEYGDESYWEALMERMKGVKL